MPGVIVVGATNLVERIDPALKRPGRLTNVITIPRPDVRAIARYPCVACGCRSQPRRNRSCRKARRRQDRSRFGLVCPAGTGDCTPPTQVDDDGGSGVGSGPWTYGGGRRPDPSHRGSRNGGMPCSRMMWALSSTRSRSSRMRTDAVMSSPEAEMSRGLILRS